MGVERKVVRELRKAGFTVLTRRQWGSRLRRQYQWRRRNRRFVGPADYFFGHITVTHPGEDPKEAMRDLENIGQGRFGTGVSYNWCLHKPSRTILVGQPHDAAGAHTVNDKNVPGFEDNLNYWGHAIAFIGMPGDEFDDWCVDAAAGIIAAEKKHGAAKPDAGLFPHSKFAYKDCPCDSYREKLGRIERRARRVLKSRTLAGNKAKRKPKKVYRPTRVVKARELLQNALRAAEKAARKRRLRDGLRRLPNR